MFPKIAGKPINLTCSEQAFPEFPDLLFGTSIDNDVSFFDATAYLQTKNLQTTVNDFFVQCDFQIRSLAESYNIDKENVCKLNHEGHFLIDGNLTYLFISFIDPDFLAYMFDRMHELFKNGFCISDTYLVEVAENRLTPDVLGAILEKSKHER